MFDLGRTLLAVVERSPDALAIVDGQRRLSYAAWYREIGRVGGGLAALGLSRRDRLAVILQNRLEMATLYAPERWVDDALFRPEVREAYRRLVAQGWTDALRALHPDERIYTFWKYFRNAFARDAGLRIDHLLLSPSLAGRLVTAGVDRDVRARERSSDHAPVWIELADVNKSPRQAHRRRNDKSG